MMGEARRRRTACRPQAIMIVELEKEFTARSRGRRPQKASAYKRECVFSRGKKKSCGLFRRLDKAP